VLVDIMLYSMFHVNSELRLHPHMAANTVSSLIRGCYLPTDNDDK
jgi:hypothetical protein